jgi:hypothetical protein
VILNISQPYRPRRPVTGIALLYFLLLPSKGIVTKIGKVIRKEIENIPAEQLNRINQIVFRIFNISTGL